VGSGSHADDRRGGDDRVAPAEQEAGLREGGQGPFDRLGGEALATALDEIRGAEGARVGGEDLARTARSAARSSSHDKAESGVCAALTPDT
jgi:hypothetical protein